MQRIGNIETRGAEEARNTLPSLLERAERGQATIITKHGRRVAAIVPVEQYEAYLNAVRARQPSLLSLRGSGAGLWGKNSASTIRAMRDEWSR